MGHLGWGGGEDRIRPRLMAVQTAGPARVHMADSHVDFQPGPCALPPGAWEAHRLPLHTRPRPPVGLLLTHRVRKCVLLYGTLYWLILAPKNNFSSLPASILGTNLFFFSPPCFWGCVMVTISVSRESDSTQRCRCGHHNGSIWCD